MIARCSRLLMVLSIALSTWRLAGCIYIVLCKGKHRGRKLLAPTRPFLLAGLEVMTFAPVCPLPSALLPRLDIAAAANLRNSISFHIRAVGRDIHRQEISSLPRFPTELLHPSLVLQAKHQPGYCRDTCYGERMTWTGTLF